MKRLIRSDLESQLSGDAFGCWRTPRPNNYTVRVWVCGSHALRIKLPAFAPTHRGGAQAGRWPGQHRAGRCGHFHEPAAGDFGHREFAIPSVSLCDLCASVVELLWKLFTTESQRSHRGTESDFSTGSLAPRLNFHRARAISSTDIRLVPGYGCGPFITLQRIRLNASSLAASTSSRLSSREPLALAPVAGFSSSNRCAERSAAYGVRFGCSLKTSRNGRP